MGVWIETQYKYKYFITLTSPPTWGCGLKRNFANPYNPLKVVTPHVGVWIETKLVGDKQESKVVTPHVGVWIETICWAAFWYVSTVTPHVGVWIETLTFLTRISLPWSHPPRGGVD